MQQSRLGGLRPVSPTLVVVDYAAQRGDWLLGAPFRAVQRPKLATMLGALAAAPSLGRPSNCSAVASRL